MDRQKEAKPELERLGYSIKEAAQVTGLGVRTIYRLLAAGTLESVKVGDRNIIKAASLRRLMDADE
jgi:excisionase family DNA binding protein